MTTGESSGSRRLVWVLAAVAGAALLAVAGLIGYIVADGADSEPTIFAAPSAATTVSPAEVPPLRPIVEAFVTDGTKSETEGVPSFRDLMNKYAVPACGQIITGLAEAFGGVADGDKTPVELLSVEQKGTTGTAVTRDVGKAKEETIHWVFDGTSWRFTCEGIFDGSSETTASPDPTTTANAAPTTEPTTQPAGEAATLGWYCGSHGATGQTADGRTAYCSRVAGTDAYKWSTSPDVIPNTAPLDYEGTSPVCDGETCTYPSGRTTCDPPAVGPPCFPPSTLNSETLQLQHACAAGKFLTRTQCDALGYRFGT